MMNLVKPDHPVLLRAAEPIGFPLSPTVRKLSFDMIAAMLQNRGCGLAAPQIGESIRMFVFHHAGTFGTVINPVIVSSNPEQIDYKEGCLTFPGKVWKTKRAKSIRVRYCGLDSTPRETELSGFLAIVFQHEIDHLDGVLISQHGVEEHV